jgi:hypothetical protein
MWLVGKFLVANTLSSKDMRKSAALKSDGSGR